MLGHMLLACPLLVQQRSREGVSSDLQEAEAYTRNMACLKSFFLFTCVYVCARTQTSLGVSLMALRYICLFSVRPSINDPAKRSPHCSQAALIYHYSALIGWISTSLPVREAGGEMSRDKQPNSQIQSGVGERERHTEARNGRLQEYREIKIQRGMREMKEW